MKGILKLTYTENVEGIEMTICFLDRSNPVDTWDDEKKTPPNLNEVMTMLKSKVFKECSCDDTRVILTHGQHFNECMSCGRLSYF